MQIQLNDVKLEPWWARDGLQTLIQTVLPIVSNCRFRRSTEMLQTHILHLSQHPDKCLINLGHLNWESRSRRWNLKNSWNWLMWNLMLLLRVLLGWSRLMWNLMIMLNLNWWGLLHVNLRTLLHLNLRTMQNLLTLLNCSHLFGNLLSSYSGILLGSLLDCLLCSLPSRILNHLSKSILINRRSRLLRNCRLDMLILSLSSNSGGLSTNNSLPGRYLKEKRKS
ncbi:hypothetical protein YC2023_050498 [Brassica napus]